jgi:hypothetical protein
MPKPRRKFEATSADGKVFKRSSVNRFYTHCVVIHFRESQGADGRVWPAYDRAEWAGSRELAQKNFSAWCGKRGVSKVVFGELNRGPLRAVRRAAPRRISLEPCCLARCILRNRRLCHQRGSIVAGKQTTPDSVRRKQVSRS